jgi:hypothetical protein
MMNRLLPLSLAVLGSIGVAAMPGHDDWLFSSVTVLCCVAAVGWAWARPQHTATVVGALYVAVLVVAAVGLAFTLADAVPKLADSSAAMPVSVDLAPESVDSRADVLDAQARLVRDGAPLGWRTLWFVVEVLPFAAGLGVLLLLRPFAREPDEPFERRNSSLLLVAGVVLVLVPLLLGAGELVLARGAATDLGVEAGYGSEGTRLLDAGAIGVGLVLLALATAVRSASELREFERSVI